MHLAHSGHARRPSAASVLPPEAAVGRWAEMHQYRAALGMQIARHTGVEDSASLKKIKKRAPGNLTSKGMQALGQGSQSGGRAFMSPRWQQQQAMLWQAYLHVCAKRAFIRRLSKEIRQHY